MGGVDLCDMLLALYRITLGTKKWYMHIVYHCIGLSIVNSWLCYRRHCEQKGIPKKDILSLLNFQTRIANGLLFSSKASETPTRGRPKRCRSDGDVEVAAKRYKRSNPVPPPEIREDAVGHFPVFEVNQGRCKNCKGGFSRIKCCKCNVRLCLVKNKNCFYDFHH